MRIDYITFDCYGTLFDWLYGIKSIIKYLTEEEDLEAFFQCEQEEIKHYQPYSRILRKCLEHVLEVHGKQYHEVYGRAITLLFAKSPPFPDTIPGLLKIKEKGYKTAIISNTEHQLIKLTLTGLEDLIDKTITAEDTGYYKPDPRAFTKALEILGVKPEDIVHVSSYPYYDLEPAGKLGIKTILLNRYNYKWKPSVKNLEDLFLLLGKLA